VTLKEELARVARRTEEYLDLVLPDERHFPEGLYKAMRYALFSGGKRIRPYLAFKSYSLFSEDTDAIMPFCAALEMIHTYSLIHDDLPCMDDDELRRGRPTCHTVFGEARALLAGDALLTHAFYTMARYSELSGGIVLSAVEALARAAGHAGMVGGQFADIESQGAEADLPVLEYIHMNKTGELIRVSCEIGAMAAGAGPAQREQMNEYGKRVGMAFQIIDDILDETGSTALLGKTAGKDKKAGKMTYPAVFGLEESKKMAADYTAQANAALKGLPGDISGLMEFALSMAERVR